VSNIKVQFRREVDVDLNAYYPSFSRKLREEIDEQLFKLLGGAPPKAGKGYKGPELTDVTILAVTNIPIRGGSATKTSVVLAELRRKLNGGKLGIYTFTYGDLRKAIDEMVKTLNLASPSSWPTNLIRAKHIEVAK